MLKRKFIKIISFLINLPKDLRGLIIVLIDTNLFFLSYVLSLWCLNKLPETDMKIILITGFLFSFFGILTYFLTGQDKNIIRYASFKTVYNIGFRNLLTVFLIVIFSQLIYEIPYSFKMLFIFWSLSSLLIAFERLILKDIIFLFNRLSISESIKVAIYGAGSAGAKLQASLQMSSKYSLKAFLDDSLDLLGSEIKGVKIYSPNEIANNPKLFNIDKILLAIPSISQSRKREIVHNISKLGLELLEVPPLEEIMLKGIQVDSLRNINFDQLLFGREPLLQDNSGYSKSLKNKVILISGSGGSIGSELCHQIITCKPKKLILIDNNEHALYLINKSLLKKTINEKIEIVSILGDVSDELLLQEIFEEYSINTVFHAAAYKHVPLVEINPIQGISNNVLSTYALCKTSAENNISKFILISSDKAVRPTNIMGASKRIAELLVQAFALEQQMNLKENSSYKSTCFAMVRFGNVLGSSGSVVPLFREQINAGGPITLTHKNIYRYFMTITEASQLVLHASNLAKGGDLFLLDMGKPIKILELARKMIDISGLTVKDKNNLNGDIEIIDQGLRPGEKLCEELLIDSKSQKTSHPLIFKACEKFIEPDQLWNEIKTLKKYLYKRDKSEVFKLVSNLVPEWKPYKG